MRTTRTILWLAALAVALTLTSCVHSLQPLYTEKDLIFDPALVGVWSEEDSKDSWAFEKSGEKEYRVTFTDSDGKPGVFQVHLLKIGGQLFLDFFPDKAAMEELKRNDFFKFHYLPAHTFARVAQIEPALQMGLLSQDWLREILAADPKAIGHEKIEGSTIVLTASTEKLQAFVLKHVEDEKAFGGLSNLKRRAISK